MTSSVQPIQLTLPTDGMFSHFDASVKSSIVTDSKGKVIEWSYISGRGNHLRSPHFHPMQRIRKTWWPS